MAWSREDRLLKAIATQSLTTRETVLIDDTIRHGIDWFILVQKAVREGLAPLLYRHCKNLGLLSILPDYVREALSRFYRQTTFYNTCLMRYLDELGDVLTKYDIPVIVLKGASLLNGVYTDIGLRPMEDIDLMVRPEDLNGLKRILKDIGYLQDNLYPNTYTKGIIYLDIHTDFLATERIRSRTAVLNIRFEDVWKRTKPFGKYGRPLFSLSIYDNLISLSFHLLKHKLTRMIWFVDIKEIISKNIEGFDWLELIRHANRIEGDRLLLYILLLTKHLVGLRVPDRILILLGKSNLTNFERCILRLRLANEQLGFLSEFLWLFQIRKGGGKVRFIIENIFPQEEVMGQIFPQIANENRLYTYIRRFMDVIFRVAMDVFLGARAIVRGGLPGI